MKDYFLGAIIQICIILLAVLNFDTIKNPILMIIFFVEIVTIFVSGLFTIGFSFMDIHFFSLNEERTKKKLKGAFVVAFFVVLYFG